MDDIDPKRILGRLREPTRLCHTKKASRLREVEVQALSDVEVIDIKSVASSITPEQK